MFNWTTFVNGSCIPEPTTTIHGPFSGIGGLECERDDGRESGLQDKWMPRAQHRNRRRAAEGADRPADIVGGEPGDRPGARHGDHGEKRGRHGTAVRPTPL